MPFARYVAQHFNDLVFPFKRYQIQRVWRGDRPQEGRFREFTQCDIDVINVDRIPLHFDAELPRIVHEVLTGLDIPAWTLNINNRKVLQGFYEGLGITDPLAVIRAVDKLHKIGADAVREILIDQAGLSSTRQRLPELAEIRAPTPRWSTRSPNWVSPPHAHRSGRTGRVLDELSDLPSERRRGPVHRAA